MKAQAYDYYPETVADPFYTPLNPLYVNPDETQINEESTLFHWIKKKKNEKKQKNTEVTERKSESDENIKEVSDIQPIKSTVENQKQKKELSRKQLVKELEKEEKERAKTEKPKKKLSNAELAKELDREEAEKERAKEKEKLEKQVVERPHCLSDFLLNPSSILPKKKKVQEEAQLPDNADIELTADFMEYFPDKSEAEATGNAKVIFKKSNTEITANKIVYNHDKNTIKVTENVVLKTGDSITEGDYLKIDLNNPDGWLENPVTDTDDIKLSAKEAYLYSDKIVEYDGVAKITKEDTINFGARSFASYLSQRELMEIGSYAKQDIQNGVYKLKADTILIDSKNDHEIITVKNADLYLRNIRIAKIPSVKIVTNKDHASAETNIPEFGSQSLLGMHLGPAVVLNVPGGSTLKLAPIVTYYKDKWGIGGIARFRNASNMTELAYGSSADKLLIRGRQKLAPGTLLEYSRLTNENEWFLGYRRPKYGAQLSYSRSDDIDDLKLTFAQRYSAGAYVDYGGKKKISRDTDWRFRWMTQTFKPIYSYTNEEGSIGINTGLALQTSASVYTTGDVNGIARFGPVINTKVGPWEQSLMYFQTAIAGKSPWEFDRYRYGHSNFLFVESLRICKYLSIGYMASLAMNRTVKSDDLIQENRALVSVGPDYAKLTIGYDTVRHNTSLMLSMLVGTKDSDIQFKKSVIKNPDKFGKKSKNKNEKTKKKSRKQYLKQIEKIEPQTETI